MYGDWQLRHMSLNHYIIKHNLFVDRMREDPNIKVITVGDAGEWSRGMLQRTADATDLISRQLLPGARLRHERIAQMRDNVQKGERTPRLSRRDPRPGRAQHHYAWTNGITGTAHVSASSAPVIS